MEKFLKLADEIKRIVKEDASLQQTLEVTKYNQFDAQDQRMEDTTFNVHLADLFQFIDAEIEDITRIEKEYLFVIFINDCFKTKHEFKILTRNCSACPLLLPISSNNDSQIIARTTQVMQDNKVRLLAVQKKNNEKSVLTFRYSEKWTLCSDSDSDDEIMSDVDMEKEDEEDEEDEEDDVHKGPDYLKTVEELVSIFQPGSSREDAIKTVKLSCIREILNHAEKNKLIDEEYKTTALRRKDMGEIKVDFLPTLSFNYRFGFYCTECEKYMDWNRDNLDINFEVNQHLKNNHEHIIFPCNKTIHSKLVSEAKDQCLYVAALFQKLDEGQDDSEMKKCFEETVSSKSIGKSSSPVKEKSLFFEIFENNKKADIQEMANNSSVEELFQIALLSIPQLGLIDNRKMSDITDVDVMLHPVDHITSREEFRSDVKKYVHDCCPEMLEFAEVVAKEQVDKGWNGNICQYAKEMTITMKKEPTKSERLILDCLPIIMKEGLKILSRCHLKGRISIVSVCERDLQSNMSASSLKRNLTTLFSELGIDAKDDLPQLIQEDSNLATSIASVTTSMFETSHHKTPKLLKEVTERAINKYCDVFQDFLKFAMKRLDKRKGKVLLPEWTKVKLHFKSCAKTIRGKKKYTANTKDVKLVAYFIWKLLNLAEKKSHTVDITEPELFCRARAVMWTLNDAMEDSAFRRYDLFDENSPQAVNSATSALLFSFRMCLLFVDDFHQSEKKLFANLPHSSITIGLSGLARKMKKFTQFFSNGIHAAETRNHLDNTPFSDSFRVRVGKEKTEVTIHTSMIRTAIKLVIFEFKKEFKETILNVVGSGHDDFTLLISHVLERNCNFKHIKEQIGRGSTIEYIGFVLDNSANSGEANEIDTCEIKNRLLSILGNKNGAEEKIKKLVLLHQKMQLLLFTLIVLGGSLGHPRGTEVPRTRLCKYKQDHTSPWAPADLIHVSNNLLNEIEIVYSGNLKSSMVNKHQRLAEETRRCFTLEFMTRLILVGILKNGERITSPLLNNASANVNNLGFSHGYISPALVFLTRFGFTVDYSSDETVALVENHTSICSKKLTEVLGVKRMQLSKWRQIRASLSNSLKEYNAKINGSKEDTFFDVLDQSGFNHEPSNRGFKSIVHATQDFVTDLPDEFTLYKDVFFEYMNGYGDMGFIFPLDLMDTDLFKSPNLSDGRKVLSLLITPSMILASKKKECLESLDCFLALSYCEDIHTLITSIVDSDKERVVLILSLEQLLMIDLKALHQNDIDIREIVYTDIPLVLRNDEDFCRFEISHRIDIFKEKKLLKIVVMPCLGREIEQKVLESVGSQVVFSTAQMQRSTAIQKYLDLNEAPSINSAFVSCNGLHNFSKTQTMFFQEQNIYKTVVQTGEFQEKDFFQAVVENSVDQGKGILLIVFLPQCFVETFDSINDCDIIATLFSLDDNSILEFAEKLEDLSISNGTVKVILSMPDAAYVVTNFVQYGIKKYPNFKTVTMCYATHNAGIFNFVQCFNCRAHVEDVFFYVHNEQLILDIENENTAFERAQEVYQDSFFNSKSMAELICSKDKRHHVAKYVGIDNLGQQINDVDSDTDSDDESDTESDAGRVTENQVLASLSTFIAKIDGDVNNVPNAMRIVSGSVVDQIQLVKSFLDDSVYNFWVEDGIRRELATRGGSKNFSALREFASLRARLRITFGLNGMDQCCFNCSLPYHDYSTFSNLRTYHRETYTSHENKKFEKANCNECIFDRRLCMISDKKQEVCDTCFTHKDLQLPSHRDACPGDILFIYVVIVFGTKDIYEAFVKTVPSANGSTFLMNYKNLMSGSRSKSRTIVELRKWMANLEWIVQNRQNNIDFWHFVAAKYS